MSISHTKLCQGDVLLLAPRSRGDLTEQTCGWEGERKSQSQPTTNISPEPSQNAIAVEIRTIGQLGLVVLSDVTQAFNYLKIGR